MLAKSVSSLDCIHGGLNHDYIKLVGFKSQETFHFTGEHCRGSREPLAQAGSPEIADQ